MQLRLRRDKQNCTAKATPGVLEVEEAGAWKFIGFTLEDTWRAPGIKIQDQTCIPAGRYRVKVTYSNRFKKPMTLIYNTNDYAVENDDIRFTGIRMHGGTGVHHTSGCPLVCERRTMDKNEPGLSGSLTEKITGLVRAAEDNNEDVWINIY